MPNDPNIYYYTGTCNVEVFLPKTGGVGAIDPSFGSALPNPKESFKGLRPLDPAERGLGAIAPQKTLGSAEPNQEERFKGLRPLDPEAPSENAFIVVNTTEPIEGAVSLRVGEHRASLIGVNDHLWVGRLPWTDSTHAQTALLTIDHDQKRFYKSYQVRAMANKKGPATLTEDPAIAYEEPLPPKGTTDTLDMPYRPVDYAENNWFNPASWTPDLGSANVSVKGIKTMSLRSKFKRGTKDDFQEGVQRDELLRLNILAQYHDLELRATIQDSSTVLDDTNKNTIELRNKDGDIFFGEYWAKLNQTELMSYNKRLDGVRGRYQWGEFELTAMVSESKGEAGFDRVYGRNTQGPYTLANRPLVVYSETLRYQGRALVRDTDYTIDYELGEITFKKDVIADTDLFEVTYEYSDSAYKKSFQAGYFSYQKNTPLRATANPNAIMPAPLFTLSRMGVGFQSLSDRGAAASGNSGVLTPGSHVMLGLDGEYAFSDVMTGKTELAFSQEKTDVSDADTALNGIAVKQNLGLSFWNTRVEGSIKKLSSSFKSLGNAAIRPGFLAYDLGIETQWQPAWRQTGDYGYERYVQNTGEVLTQSLGYTTQVGPISYAYYQSVDRNLSVTSNLFEKKVQRHTGRFDVDLPVFRLSPGYRVENVEDVYAPSQNYTSQTMSLGAKLLGPEWFQLSGSVERRTQEKNTGFSAKRDTVGMATALAMSSDYSMDGTVRYTQDSEEGKSALALGSYTFRPWSSLRLNGNYSLETLQEILGSEMYRVMKHHGSFQFSFRPISSWRLTYRLRPTFSEVRIPGTPRYEDRLTHQYTLSADLLENLVAGADIRQSRKQLLDKSKLPDTVVSSEGEDNLRSLQLDYRVTDASTLRYGVEHELGRQDSLQTSSSPNTYERTYQNNLSQNIEYTHQLTPSVKLGTAYRSQRMTSEQKIATASNVDTGTRSLEASTEWQVDRGLNLKLTGATSETEDFKGVVPKTYMTQPRLDWRLKPDKSWTISGFFELSNSFSGQPTSRRKGSITLRYDTLVAGFLDTTVSAQMDYESESSPRDYDTYDVLLKLTMML
jgi:hypothetical protein